MIRPDASHGVFETLLVRDGSVQALDAHLDRLAASVSELYAASLPEDARSQILNRARNLSGEHRLRVDAVPHAGGADTAVTTSPLTAPWAGATLGTPATISGGLGPHKWRDRRHLDALAEREGPGRAVLITDDDGQVLEAAWANVWLLECDGLRTPAADGRILPGVARSRLLSLAPSLGLQADEMPIPLTDVQRAPTVFLTSSLRVAALTRPRDPSARVDPRIVAIAEALDAGDWT
ncbi:MAG: aminotransferase class IV [Actinomycetota bacterium]|nr:aminotransferase class IV [Actinomycetota bacterium]